MSGSASNHDLDLITDVLLARGEVEKLIRLEVFRTDAGTLVGAKIAVAGETSVREIADLISEIEAQIRAAVPAVGAVYVQPDAYRPSLDPEPPTDVFVLKSAD